MNKELNYRGKGYNVFYLLVISLFILHTIPIIGYITPNYIYMVVVLLFGLTTLAYCRSKRFFKYFFLALLICLPHFLRILKLSNDSLYIWLYSLLQSQISLTFGLAIINKHDYKLAKNVLIIVLVAYTLTAISTYYGNILIPGASRYLAIGADIMDSSKRTEIERLNIGGFSFIYILVLWIPIIIGMLRVKIIPHVLMVSLIIIYVLTIYISEYATALLLTFPSFLLLIHLKGDLSIKRSKRLFALYTILVVLGIGVLPSLLSYMSNNTESSLLSARFNEVSSYLDNPGGLISNESSDIGARRDLYLRSINEFIRHPLVGTDNLKALGSHSLLFDLLGLFGIVGGLLYILMWVIIYKCFIKAYRYKTYYGFFLTSYILSILLTILNPQFFPFFISFIVPCSLLSFEDRARLESN